MANISWKTSKDILDHKKKVKKENLKMDCQNNIFEGFTSSITDSNGIAYQFGYNQHDQADLNAKMSLILLWKDQLNKGQINQTEYDSHFPIKMKTKNCGVVSLSEDKFFQVVNDSQSHKQQNKQRFWDLETQVEGAATETDIDSISW